MICSIIAASALALLPVTEKTRTHSVEHFDARLRVTERVLDRSICPDIERTQAPDAVKMVIATESQRAALRAKAARTAKKNADAVTLHCKSSTRVSARDERECNLN